MGEEMREIKFRAWDKDENEMIYGINECLMNWDGLQHNVDRFLNMPSHIPVMQFTTLKDNENKELYFYDAIETYAGNRKLGRTVIKSLDDLVNLINEMTESGINFKIIGNELENPELLNK